MADGLIELGLEIASILPDDKNEKRYGIKILQTIQVIVIIPLFFFLLLKINFTNSIHIFTASVLFLIFILFLISYFAKDGKIRKFLFRKKVSRTNAIISFILIFLIISLTIFTSITPSTETKEENTNLKTLKIDGDK